MNKKVQTIEQLDKKFKAMDERNLAEHLIHIWNDNDSNGEWVGDCEVDNCVAQMRAGDRRLLLEDLIRIIYESGVYSVNERHTALEIINRLLTNWLPSYMRKLY